MIFQLATTFDGKEIDYAGAVMFLNRDQTQKKYGFSDEQIAQYVCSFLNDTVYACKGKVSTVVRKDTFNLFVTMVMVHNNATWPLYVSVHMIEHARFIVE